MKKNVVIAKRIMAACVVATGTAIVWGVVVGWLGMIKETLKPAGEVSYDNVIFTADGTPLIRTDRYVSGVTLVVDRRTLEGKPWPMNDEDLLNSAYLPEPYKEPAVIDLPMPW